MPKVVVIGYNVFIMAHCAMTVSSWRATVPFFGTFVQLSSYVCEILEPFHKVWQANAVTPKPWEMCVSGWRRGNFKKKGGETMSLETVKKVTDAEQDVKVRKAQTAQEAKRIVAQAQRDGQRAVDSARAKAKAEVAKLLEQAEQRSAEKEAQVVRETEGACESLRAQAQGRLAEAAALIVGKVVDA